MAKNKNKQNKAAAKAAKNLEALKKAKENIEAKKAEETKSAGDAPKEEIVDKRTGVYDTPVGETSYDTHQLCRKSNHMALVSIAIEKDKKGVKNVKSVWKNNNNGETVSCLFSVSNVKEGDGIDLERIEKGIENPIPAEVPESTEELKPEETEVVEETAKENPKEAPKEQADKGSKNKNKPKNKAKDKEIEVVEAEDVSNAPTVQIPSMSSSSSTDRIDANHSIDLMNAVLKRREEIKDNKALYQAAGKQADIMMWVLLRQWNDQFRKDAEEHGFLVNEDMYNYLDATASMFLGVKLIGSKENDGQLRIDFNETMKNASPQVKTAIEQDAKALEKIENKKVETPKPEDCNTDKEKLDAIRKIMLVRHNGVKGGIGKNLTTAIDFAKKAYSIDSDEPAQILANIFTKFRESGETTGILEGITNAIHGNLVGNLNNLAAHAWLRAQLPNLSDQSIANLVKVIIAKKAEDEAKYAKKKEDEVRKGYSRLIGGLNDDLINRIVKCAKEDGKDENKLTYAFDFKAIPVKTSDHIYATKTINNLKTAYSAQISESLLLTKMKQINALYVGTTINPLSVYTEKSAYAAAK